MKKTSLFFAFLLIVFSAQAEKPASQCFGNTVTGRLVNGWQLPSSGKNFDAYSSLGVAAGRNYVHSKVYETVTEAYKTLETTAPDTKFIYGETGFKNGGRFRPHKTHANGLSVDFFVPVINKEGESVKLPISVFNKLGYNIEFDESAQYDDLTIDFEAMAKHLLAIHQAAKSAGIAIGVVIFDLSFQKKLFASPSGKDLQSLMRFSAKKSWVRHDEHYHIDFIVECSKDR